MRSADAAHARFADDDERWAAVTRRDRGADGAFLYSVRTTGVYCRPSCGARLPRRENVSFHADRAAAERAGYRPCRRCRPDTSGIGERRAEAVARACRLIDAGPEPPGLAALAAAAGMSPHHFHRVFRAVAGVTPKAYAASRRAERVRMELRTAGSVTEALYAAGFRSGAGFYAAAPRILGMAPSRFRQGGRGERIRFAVEACSLGAVLVGATGQGVCAVLLGDDREDLLRDLRHRFPSAELTGGDPEFEGWVAAVLARVECPAVRPDLPLDVRGTAFQQRVWRALAEIPAGSTATYAEIARRIGAPRAARAVAGACAANPVAVAIPCHRVVRGDGELGGYRWGIDRKRALLQREAGAGGGPGTPDPGARTPPPPHASDAAGGPDRAGR